MSGELIVPQDAPRGGQYPLWFMRLWVELVVSAGLPLRSIPRVIVLLNQTLHLGLPCPDWTTGRTWLLRLGLWELRRPLPQGGPGVTWVWIVDHAVQIGKEKMLPIVGLRLEDLPADQPWPALQFKDVQLVWLVPMKVSNANLVQQELEQAVARTGVPRAIVGDHGADLYGGVKRFCESHPETGDIYDASHYTACLLKARLEKDRRWQEFQTLAARTRVQLVQTELACLQAPRLRMKSRYMNLEPLLEWGIDTLRVLQESRAGCPPLDLTAERIEQKLGWLDAFQEPLQEWREWLEHIAVLLKTIREQGHSHETPALLQSRLPEPNHASTRELSQQLQTFVSEHARRSRPGERLPGSSEVLESAQGKLKMLERTQSQEGFTRFTLSLGAALGNAVQRLGQAAEQITNHAVETWNRTAFGQTLAARRCIVNARNRIRMKKHSVKTHFSSA